MKNFKIVAIAPTTYQLSSLRRFGISVKSLGNGSHISEMFFDSEKDAQDYLIVRAEMYYDEYEGHADDHIEDILRAGALTIDAITAKIEEVEIEEED